MQISPLYWVIPGCSVVLAQSGGDLSDQAWIMYENGEIPDALKLIEMALRIAPSDSVVITRHQIISSEMERLVGRFIREGDMFMAANNLGKALESYTYVLELDPNNGAALAKIKRLNSMSVTYIDFFSMMDEKYGYEANSQIADSDATAVAMRVVPPPSARQHLFNARRLMSQGKWKEALEMALKVRGLMPGKEGEIADLIARLEMNLNFSRDLENADRSYRKGDFKTAMAIYEKIESSREIDPLMGLRLADCYSRNAMADKARNVLEKYSASLSPVTLYQIIQARISDLKGQTAKGAWLLWKLKKSGKDDREFDGMFWSFMFRAYWIHWTVIIILFMMIIYFVLLIRNLNRDLAFSSGYDLIMALRAMRKGGKRASAEFHIAEVLKKSSSTNRPWCYGGALSLRGMIFLEKGRFKEAASDFANAAELIPGLADHQFNCGVAAMSDPFREKEAPEYFQKAMQLLSVQQLQWSPVRLFPLAKPELKSRVPSATVSAMFVLVRDLLRKGKVGAF